MAREIFTPDCGNCFYAGECDASGRHSGSGEICVVAEGADQQDGAPSGWKPADNSTARKFSDNPSATINSVMRDRNRRFAEANKNAHCK